MILTYQKLESRIYTNSTAALSIASPSVSTLSTRTSNFSAGVSIVSYYIIIINPSASTVITSASIVSIGASTISTSFVSAIVPSLFPLFPRFTFSNI